MEFDEDRDVVDQVMDDIALVDLLLDVGGEVVALAQARAPRSEGAHAGQGAASIHVELHRGAPRKSFASTYTPEDANPTVYVSWDQDHFYMGFAELGTEKQTATPFLRPALEAVRI